MPQPRRGYSSTYEDIRKGIKFNDDLENDNLISIAQKNAHNENAVIKPTLIYKQCPCFWALLPCFSLLSFLLQGSLLPKRKDGTYTDPNLACYLSYILWGKVEPVLVTIWFSFVVIDDCGGYVFLRMIYGIPALSLAVIMWH